MMRVDTSQEMVIFPKPIGWKMIAPCFAIALLGAVVIPMAWPDREWGMVVLGAGLLAVGLLIAIMLFRKRNRGAVDATLKLSPEGLHLMTGTTGVIAWPMIKNLGSMSIKGSKALVINIDKAAIDGLEKSRFFETSRKLDKALGIHGLTFFEQQLELPVAEVAHLLHQYSIAHGGPALQPDP